MSLRNQRQGIAGQRSQLEIEVPKDAGPAALGKTPLLGAIRRSLGVPVLRDMLNPTELGASAGLTDEDDSKGIPENLEIRGSPPQERIDDAIELAKNRSGSQIIAQDDGRVIMELQASGSIIEMIQAPQEEAEVTETRKAKRSMSEASAEKHGQ